MPSLVDFMESLTQEQDKLVQMGTIKYTKDQYLATSVSNQAKCKNKVNYLSNKERKRRSIQIQKAPVQLMRIQNSRGRRVRERDPHHEIY